MCVYVFLNVSDSVCWRQVLLDSLKHPIHRLPFPHPFAEMLLVKNSLKCNNESADVWEGKHTHTHTHSRRKCYVSYNPVSKVGHPSQTDATNWLELNIDTRYWSSHSSVSTAHKTFLHQLFYSIHFYFIFF